MQVFKLLRKTQKEKEVRGFFTSGAGLSLQKGFNPTLLQSSYLLFTRMVDIATMSSSVN